MTGNDVLSEYELHIVEDALLHYGRGLRDDQFRDRESTASAIKKINRARQSSLSNAVALKPM